MPEPTPLSPAMASRKAQALAFVTDYIGRWRYGPSYAEIGAALGVSRKRAHQLVNALVRDGRLLGAEGRARGLRLPETVDRALEELRAAGWRVNGDVLLAPGRDPGPFTNWPLTLIGALDEMVASEGGPSDDQTVPNAARRDRRGRRGRARRAA